MVWFGGTDLVAFFCDPIRFVFVAIVFQNISCNSVKCEMVIYLKWLSLYLCLSLS